MLSVRLLTRHLTLDRSTKKKKAPRIAVYNVLRKFMAQRPHRGMPEQCYRCFASASIAGPIGPRASQSAPPSWPLRPGHPRLSCLIAVKTGCPPQGRALLAGRRSRFSGDFKPCWPTAACIWRRLALNMIRPTWTRAKNLRLFIFTGHGWCGRTFRSPAAVCARRTRRAYRYRHRVIVSLRIVTVIRAFDPQAAPSARTAMIFSSRVPPRLPGDRRRGHWIAMRSMRARGAGQWRGSIDAVVRSSSAHILALGPAQRPRKRLPCPRANDAEGGQPRELGVSGMPRRPADPKTRRYRRAADSMRKSPANFLSCPSAGGEINARFSPSIHNGKWLRF